MLLFAHFLWGSIVLAHSSYSIVKMCLVVKWLLLVKYQILKSMYKLSAFLQELERKSQVKLNTLLEIETAVQKKWESEKTFEEDAPQVCICQQAGLFVSQW